MRFVWQIGAKPHPTGSPANAEVREYLVKELKALGLSPVIQAGLAQPQGNRQTAGSRQMGRVHNVLAKLAGQQPGKALLLVAHYDSVRSGPGAADNGASVAAILETMRAVKTQPALQNDVICLFTDGEEDGLLGAIAFVAQHPWLKDVGLVLNFEYRGNSGAFLMFETSADNGKLIEGLAEAVPSIQANSFMFEVYNRMPNDTDFTVFKQAGIPGMNFAAIDGFGSYHTASDRPEFLDQGALQHEGDIMLALVKEFGGQSLDNMKAPNRIYFDIPGFGIVHYPQSWINALAILSIIIFLAVGIKTYKSKAIRLMPLLVSTIFYPLLVVILFFINNYLMKIIQLFDLENHNLSFGLQLSGNLFFVGLMLLDVAVIGGVVLALRKWLRPMEAGLAVASSWLILNGVLSQIPGATFLTLWPLLAVLLSYLSISIKAAKKQSGTDVWIFFLGILPVFVLYSPLIKNLFIALTVSGAAVILIPYSFAIGLLMPILLEIFLIKARV